MKKIIGNKNVFAIEIEVLSFTSQLWGKTSIYVQNNCFGYFKDENMLGPFIVGINRLLENRHTLYNESLMELNCHDSFYKIHPFYNNHDGLYDLSDEEFEKIEDFDEHIFFFGENFDDWIIDVVMSKTECKFLWVYIPNRDADTFEVRNNIQCNTVSIAEVENVCKEVCQLLDFSSD